MNFFSFCLLFASYCVHSQGFMGRSFLVLWVCRSAWREIALRWLRIAGAFWWCPRPGPTLLLAHYFAQNVRPIARKFLYRSLFLFNVFQILPVAKTTWNITLFKPIFLRFYILFEHFSLNSSFAAQSLALRSFRAVVGDEVKRQTPKKRPNASPTILNMCEKIANVRHKMK